MVAMLSVLREEKGHDVGIAAVAALRRRFPHIRLLVVGDGEARERLEALAAPGSGAVTFAGHRDDVMEVLDAADVLLHPSRIDAFPGALLEAMAAGVPVVATAVGGIPDIVDDGVTGVLVAAAAQSRGPRGRARAAARRRQRSAPPCRARAREVPARASAPSAGSRASGRVRGRAARPAAQLNVSPRAAAARRRRSPRSTDAPSRRASRAAGGPGTRARRARARASRARVARRAPAAAARLDAAERVAPGAVERPSPVRAREPQLGELVRPEVDQGRAVEAAPFPVVDAHRRRPRAAMFPRQKSPWTAQRGTSVPRSGASRLPQRARPRRPRRPAAPAATRLAVACSAARSSSVVPRRSRVRGRGLEAAQPLECSFLRPGPRRSSRARRTAPRA